MTDHIELWRPIPGFEGHYDASDLGRIRSVKRATPHIMAQQWTGKYFNAMICMNGRYRPYGVHRLVCMAFHGEPPSPGLHACHDNGDPTDNRPANLYWGTPGDNAVDMVRHGRHRNARKTHCDRGHEFTPGNTYMRPSGKRLCRTCKRDYERERYIKRRQNAA
ncbi:HNH endonuclease [Gordonia phage Cafasso]|uniref:HNH endonuclease n=1 Tax=Gordonia phage Cafasso TaxID=2851095 RepID=A0AAE7SCD2_9CAUD|nr:HNH endonuclease [Gordonia phage Cafasso]